MDMGSPSVARYWLDDEGHNMKKLLPLLLTTALACCFTVPTMAEDAAVSKEAKKVEETATPQADETDTQLQGFVIRHQVDNAKMSEGENIKADPLVLLHTLKADVTKYLETKKPLNLKTTVTPILAERLDKELKNVPALILETFIDEEGQGETKFDVPKYKHTVPEDKNGGEVDIDWKGLDGQFVYPETFENIKADLTLQGLSISEKDAFSMALGQLKFVAELDEDLLPLKMKSTLPSLMFKDDMSKLTLAKLALETEMQVTASQVEISQGKFNIGNASFDVANKNNAKLQAFQLTFGGEEKDKTVSLMANLSVKDWTLSEAIMGETLTLNHTLDVALNHLDAPATAQLQQTVRELQNQLHSGKISEDILNFAMFGQLMQLAPAFLAKSPELALSNIHISTKNKGKLNGNLQLGVNGQKAKSLTNMMELLMALTMQADFKMDKPLLKLALTASLGSEGSADTRIKALLKDKTIVETEENYTLSATIVDNKLTLNGQDMGAPMDLFMLLMPLAIQ
ncbi:DUF945 family protein [Candidatus Albibeggiatoa sp. nov. NOAA]|uniref:DUF945 family protein n=1 Tax=Candidatus Albibeggiatoa sp. nov. NOAA TaxID=3162724 RepID=UPI0032F570D2|nr:YdgA family protein [Thiotrichaceae bacterium]